MLETTAGLTYMATVLACGYLTSLAVVPAMKRSDRAAQAWSVALMLALLLPSSVLVTYSWFAGAGLAVITLAWLMAIARASVWWSRRRRSRRAAPGDRDSVRHPSQGTTPRRRGGAAENSPQSMHSS
jgi:protein-S-isoprenylcysteine O-methyltransferase Ste14